MIKLLCKSQNHHHRITQPAFGGIPIINNPAAPVAFGSTADWIPACAGTREQLVIPYPWSSPILTGL